MKRRKFSAEFKSNPPDWRSRAGVRMYHGFLYLFAILDWFSLPTLREQAGLPAAGGSDTVLQVMSISAK